MTTPGGSLRALGMVEPQQAPTPETAAPRGPLRHIILISTGQDVGRCINCAHCDRFEMRGMDLSFGEILQAAARDDPIALTNNTLWACDDLLLYCSICHNGLDIPSVILALQREAEQRGLAPQETR
jgi:heterodisulfide reductase subunit C